MFWLKIFGSILVFFAVCACSTDRTRTKEENIFSENQIDNNSDKQATILFDEDFVDLGTIKHGEVISYTFGFSNTGNIPLVITDVNAGCGCTRTKLSKKVIKPAEKATLVVVFDSKGWHGVQFKSATLVSNALTPKRSVTIKVNVIS
jgi:hypothetical protein